MTLKTPIFLENDTTTQNSDELRLERMYLTRSRSGVHTSGSMAVTQRAAGANMSVDIAAGAAVIVGTENALQGSYHVTNDATVNVVITAADLTNPRKDLVIVKVRDSFYSGANNDAQFLVVAGTPAASPAEPDLVALGHKNYHVLAMVDVPAADTAITDSQITDRRFRASVIGSDMVGTAAQRTALTGMTESDTFYETDTDRLWIHNGTDWVQNGIIGAWTPYTPSINGWSLGNGTIAAAYNKVGRTVTYRVTLTAGSTTTFGSGINIALPFASAADTWSMGGMASDVSAGVFAPLVTRAVNTNLTPYPLTSVTQMSNGGAFGNAPFAWAANDVLYAQVIYEATS